ncbi:glycine betaine ABC transporter substrate-binding protein [Burkholderia sp. S171]|uniref:glycine betaine ABC transporter substrate-binding protein n=1 Tax=Burkholderia sp. S171 TaxID=1641860 RepID=UPI00131A75CC|nr:glycine betaine ABC transporter substrate-binding protein [Burkholderia sp. S171]
MRKYILFKTLVVAAMSFLANGSAIAAPPICNQGAPVKFAELGWDSGRFYTELFRVILERGYGCKTESIPGTNAISQNALITGDLDVFAEYPTGRTLAVEQAAAEGKLKLVGNLLQGGIQEGFYVPEYVIKGDVSRNIKPLAPDLQSVPQLAKYATIFADDEDPSKGRILNCPIGWQCESDNAQKIKAYGLASKYTNFHPGTGAALDATIVSAFQRGKPIVFYYWQPTSILGKYKAIRLTEAPYNEACWKTISDKATAAPCPSASPPNTVKAILSQKISASEPQLLALANNVSLTMDSIQAQLAKLDGGKMTARQAADDYIQANPESVKQWLPSGIAEKVLASKSQ